MVIEKACRTPVLVILYELCLGRNSCCLCLWKKLEDGRFRHSGTRLIHVYLWVQWHVLEYDRISKFVFVPRFCCVTAAQDVIRL
jgi:hypothetical protein